MSVERTNTPSFTPGRGGRPSASSAPRERLDMRTGILERKDYLTVLVYIGTLPAVSNSRPTVRMTGKRCLVGPFYLRYELTEETPMRRRDVSKALIASARPWKSVLTGPRLSKTLRPIVF